MRFAFLVAPKYTRRPALARCSTSSRDADAVRDKLSRPGFDFRVVDVPDADTPAGWLGHLMTEHHLGVDDAVVVYVSAVAQLDEAGELALEVDRAEGEAEGELRTRIPVARIRSALTTAGVSSAALVMDLVHQGDQDPVLASEMAGAVRRIFAPELSGYSILCAVRSVEQAMLDKGGPAPFTSLLLRTIDKAEVRNTVGVVLVSRVMEQVREDPDLYTDVPCFSLVAGRRDLSLFSATTIAPPAPNGGPLSTRMSSPPSSRPGPGISELLDEATAARERGELDVASELFKKALLLLEDKSPTRADVYVELARLKAAQGRRREAALNFRKAVAITAGKKDALEGLAGVLHAEGDFAEAAKVRRELLAATSSPEERFDVLLALADDEEKARNVTGTLEALELARELRAQDTAVLARLAQVYDSQHAFDRVVEIKVAIAQLKPQAEEVARSLVLAADFAAERAASVDRALELYGLALDQDPVTARAFDAIASVLIERGDDRAYEQALLAQTVRLDRAGAHAAEAEIWRTIAELRRGRLDDVQGAIEALDRCVERIPTDVEARVELAGMLAEAGEEAAALMSLEIAAWHAPGRSDTYRAMMNLCAQAGDLDRAWNASAALSQLGDADMDEDLYFQQYQPDAPVRPTRSLDDAAWQWIYPLSHDQHVRAILRVAASPAIEYKLQQLRSQGQLPELDPRARQDPETSTVSVTRTFKWASRILDVPLPEIYVTDEVPGGIAAVPAEMPTALVGRSVLTGRSLKELAFLVGRDITFYRPEHYVLVMYPSLRELTTLFLAAVRVVRPTLPLPEATRREIGDAARFIERKVTGESRRELELAVEHFEQAGGRADLTGWARSVELAAMRAGLLLCGDVQVVQQVLSNDDREVGDLTVVDRMNDLMPFLVSEAYGKLRDRLGVRVSDVAGEAVRA